MATFAPTSNGCPSDPNYTKFNSAENQAIAITPKFTSMLSILGVSVIIYRFIIMKPSLRNVYQRLLFGMSIMNFFGSIGFFLGEWTFNNTSFCSFQGWLLQINSAVFWYNGCLATNFLLRIYYEWNEHSLVKIEPLLHVIAWCFPAITSFISLGLNFYAPSGPWCWIGTSYDWARWAFFYGELWIIMIYTAVVMGLIVIKVEESDKKNRANLGGGKNLTRRQRKTREVSLQAIFYVASFLLTWVFGTANRIQNAIAPGCQIFALVWLHCFFVPLQGFFNFLVYMQPRYNKWRSNLKAKGIKHPVRKTLKAFFVGTDYDSESRWESKDEASTTKVPDNSKKLSFGEDLSSEKSKQVQERKKEEEEEEEEEEGNLDNIKEDNITPKTLQNGSNNAKHDIDTTVSVIMSNNNAREPDASLVKNNTPNALTQV